MILEKSILEVLTGFWGHGFWGHGFWSHGLFAVEGQNPASLKTLQKRVVWLFLHVFVGDIFNLFFQCVLRWFREESIFVISYICSFLEESMSVDCRHVS